MQPRRLSVLAVSVLIISACIVSSTAYSGNLLMMITPLLGKHNGPTAPLSHQAVMVGPLAGASIKAFKIAALAAPAEGPKAAVQSNNLLSAGTFDLSLAGLADNEWVVVEAGSGADIDANGDGIADTSPAANQGTLHALARASDWRTKHLRITPLTEISWRYVENLINDVSEDDLEMRLADIARHLVKTDINGNGVVDWDDILTFDPANAAHRNKLAFNYELLSTANNAGQTIISSMRAGETNAVLAQLDATFSWLITRFPVPDSRYGSVKVTLAVFGPGRASSGAPHNLLVDSTLTVPIYEDHIFLSESSSSITFTAAPASEAQILSWSGCEEISADLRQCTVSLNRSQSVVINFGRTKTQLKGIVHDLSRAENTVSAGAIFVQLADDLTDLINEMTAANVGDFVVGDDGDGFLRRITKITRLSSASYQFETEEAALDEVIAQGTAHIYKQLTNGDLAGYTAPSVKGQQAIVSPTAFVGPKGASLRASANPDDHTFVIKLGDEQGSSLLEEAKAMEQALAAEVVLYDDGKGGTISAKGEIKIDVFLDSGADYSFSSGLQAFKFIVHIDAEQSVELAASSELKKVDFVKKKIGALQFARIPITGLPIPVWVTPTADVFFFAEGKVEATVSFGISFSQNAEGGLLYNKDTGFSIHKSFSSEKDLIPPTASISASIKGGIEVSPSLKIYDSTGPALPEQLYSKIEISDSFDTNGCFSEVMQNIIGFESFFKWDMGLFGTTRFGKFLHLDKLEEKSKFTIFNMEWLYKAVTLNDRCPGDKTGPFLVVNGNGILSEINFGDTNGLATTLKVSNTGDQELHWKTSGVPSEVTISPSSGVLAPGAEELVQMSVATAALPVGRYLRRPLFYNEASLGQNLPDEEFGNTRKTIDIIVNHAISDTPVITAATSPAVGKASLNWSFTPSGSEPLIGFQIFATQTPQEPESYKLVSMAGINDRQTVISGLTPSATYTFKMRVYSNNNSRLGPFSNTMSVQVSGNPPSLIKTVTSATGRVWMDRNLGASRAATSMTDTEAYGDLYQWGRGQDGHEKRTSGTTATVSSTDTPGHSNFITADDWRSPHNPNLWQGANGVNNPCPAGFRLPTYAEFDKERLSWSTLDAVSAFASPLKLVTAGLRSRVTGALSEVGVTGYYWSSTVPMGIYFNNNTASGFGTYLGYGFSVRCIKDNAVQVSSGVLNDTGITWSGNYASGNNTACVASTTPNGNNVVAAQDCSHGRDVTHNDDSDGHAGFSYTKLDSNGQPLANQDADYATTPWACVKDNVTGLIWEVKTDDGGLHDKDDTYTWYNTNPKTNGGSDGYTGDYYGGNTCYGYSSGNSATFCNTQAYVNRVNAVGWCGASDWRMPTHKELESLVAYDRDNLTIDTDYFLNIPNAAILFFWSGSPGAEQDSAWLVDFESGGSYLYSRGYPFGYPFAVRLVHGGTNQ